MITGTEEGIMRKSITRLTAIVLSGSVLMNSVFGFALTVRAVDTKVRVNRQVRVVYIRVNC